MDDFNKRWDSFAVYLPSIQKAYAKSVYGPTPTDRSLPTGLKLRDLNFLNPKSKLWHYKYALYSAGQFKVGERQADIVTNRDELATTVLGDSGGFQIGKGTLQGFDALKKCRTADEVCKRWRDAKDVKQWIVNWLELHSNYAMTIDMPLWAKLPQNAGTPFHKCSVQQLIDLSVENLEFIARNQQGNTKWLNVIQGVTEADMKLWWDAVKGYKLGGWALAGSVGWRGGIGTVTKQLLMMRDEGALREGQDWIHVLGVSQPKWAVLLSAMQRGLREHVNPNIRFSYDSASPNILAGRYSSVAMYPNYTKDANTWAFRVVKAPHAIAYSKQTPEFHFPHSSPVGDLLKLHHLNIKGERYSRIHYDEITYHLLTHHNTWVYVRALLEANELAFMEKEDAKQFVPTNLLNCIHLIQELIGTKKWQTKWSANKRLFDSVDKLNDAANIEVG